jgi:hypothetical protein
MLRLRPVATVIAVLAFATPLFAQTAATVRDTTALARLPVYITAVAPATLIGVGAATPDRTAAQATPTSVARMPATWTNGDGSHATPVAMMIVGGIGLFVGTVVSGKPGTTIMIGSGILGLVGLWRYAK